MKELLLVTDRSHFKSAEVTQIPALNKQNIILGRGEQTKHFLARTPFFDSDLKLWYRERSSERSDSL